MTFRAVKVGKAFAPWVRALQGKSGVYVIRGRLGKRVFYVGESHSGKLYRTLTRHFQGWRDDEGRKHFVFPPGSVEVGVQATVPSMAVQTQNEFICRLKPRDNGNAGGLCVIDHKW